MGSLIKSIGKAIKKVFKGIAKFVKKYIKQIIVAVVVVAAIYFTAGAAAPALLGPSVVPAAAVAAPVAGAGTGAMLAAPVTGAAGSSIAGSSTVGSILAGGAGGTSAASGAIAAAGTPAGLAATPVTAGIATGAASAVPSGVGVAGSGLEGTFGIASAESGLEGTFGIAASDAGVAAQDAYAVSKNLAEVATNPTLTASEIPKQTVMKVTTPNSGVSPATQQIGLQNAADTKILIGADLDAAIASNPGLFSDAVAKQNIFQKMAGGASNFAEKHPYMTYGLLQTAGAMMKPDPNAAKERQVALQAGGASPSGQIWNGSEMVDFKDSPQASARFKREAGVVPAAPIPAVAPVEITTTPLAELPAPAGLINPPAPAKISMANAELANKGLLGNVKITGT